MIKMHLFVILCILCAQSFGSSSDEIETELKLSESIEEEGKEEEIEATTTTKIQYNEELIERRKSCDFIYKSIQLPVCHPLARHDALGNCLKIVSLNINCPPNGEQHEIIIKKGDNDTTTEIITDNLQ